METISRYGLRPLWKWIRQNIKFFATIAIVAELSMGVFALIKMFGR